MATNYLHLLEFLVGLVFFMGILPSPLLPRPVLILFAARCPGSAPPPFNGRGREKGLLLGARGADPRQRARAGPGYPVQGPAPGARACTTPSLHLTTCTRAGDAGPSHHHYSFTSVPPPPPPLFPPSLQPSCTLHRPSPT